MFIFQVHTRTTSDHSPTVGLCIPPLRATDMCIPQPARISTRRRTSRDSQLYQHKWFVELNQNNSFFVV